MNFPNHKNCQILIIGLGYVGLPLAVEFSKQKRCIKNGTHLKRDIIGFDIDSSRIEELKGGFDRTNEIDSLFLKSLQKDNSLKITKSIEEYTNSDFLIVTVPTPIDKFKKPDLSPLKNGCKLIGKLLKNRSSKIKPIIIFESTVYPGVTEEICAEIIQKESGLIFNHDFFCGYSPERINPGDKNHNLTSIIKVVSGSTKEAASIVEKLYESIISAGTHLATSIKVAEAAKVIENTQRDLNIALINELAILFKKMDLDIFEILTASETKWNFLPFKPGLVGGHCIGVDPYYLTHKAKEIGYVPKVILAGREINDRMAEWVAGEFLLECQKRNLLTKPIKVMILGITFKENCPDFRNTKVIEIIEILNSNNFELTIVDPWVNKKAIRDMHKYDVLDEIPSNEKFDSVICVVAHNQFLEIEIHSWENMINENGFFFDIKNMIPKELNPVRI